LGIGNVTEVTLLGILSAQAAERGSVLSCLVLPVLFTAALILIDTTEGCLLRTRAARLSQIRFAEAGITW
jgi:high-affinity nickel permease